MEAWQMMGSLHAYLIGGSVIKTLDNQSDDGKHYQYEIETPYQDSKGRIILYASIDGDRIRLTDAGYLMETFLKTQDPDSPFQIDMGVADTGQENECKLEDDELVLYCTIDNFGQSVCTMAHGIILIGTSKSTMLMMVQIFNAIMTETSQPNISHSGDLGWPGESGPAFEA